MMLTAGLGVSEMMIGWDNVVLEVGGVMPLLLMYDAVDTPLEYNKRNTNTCWALRLSKLKLLQRQLKPDYRFDNAEKI